MPEQTTKGSRPLMAGWCKKRGTIGYHPRYYALTSDGKLWSSKNDNTTQRKQMLNMTETTQLNPVKGTDLVIKGQNAKGRSVSINLRFNETTERDEWVGAFITATEDIVEQNKIIRKEEEMEQSVEDHNYQVLLNYYYTYKPENATKDKVDRFLKLFKGNMAKLAQALGHKYGVTPDLETTDDVDYLPTPSFDGIFTPATATIVEEDEDDDSDSSDDRLIESKMGDGGLLKAVHDLLASEPPLIYDPDALRLGLQTTSPHLRPTQPQLEGILKAYRLNKRDEDEQLQIAPSPVMASDMQRLRTHLTAVTIEQEDLLLLMWELKLSPRSIPFVEDVGETLLGIEAQKISLRYYVDGHGSDMAKRLMAYNDPVEFMSKRKNTRTCRREFARAFLLDTPRSFTDDGGNVRKDSMLSQFLGSNQHVQEEVGRRLLQYYSPFAVETMENDRGDRFDGKSKERCCDCRIS